MADKLNRQQFEAAYRAYMDANGYAYEPWDIAWEWQHYERGRSFFVDAWDWWLKTCNLRLGERGGKHG